MKLKILDLRFQSSILFILLNTLNYNVHAQPQYLNLGPPEYSHPLAVLISALVFIFFIIVFFSVYLRHYLELNAAASDTVSRTVAVSADRCVACRGLDPDVIRTFPVVSHSKLKETEMGKWSLECAVCLCEFRDCETLRLLPKCGHVFHTNCIDAWLSSCATCPICRAKLTVGGENSVLEFVAIGAVADETDDRNDDEDSEAVDASSEEVCPVDLSGTVAGGGDVAEK